MAVHWAARLRPAAAILLVAVAAFCGGTVAASLWPVTVETDYYAAEVQLSPHWAERSRLGTDTVVGDVTADFAGLAPGIRVHPRVKPQITQLVDSGDVSSATLGVDESERSRVIREAATGLGLRFAVGAVGAGGLVLLVLRRREQQRLSLRATAAGAVTIALVCAGTAWTTWYSYSPDRFRALHSTGLLELAAENRGLLGDVEERVEKGTPYLRSLLALSSAVQQEYAPGELPGDGAVRALLVSDIHAANQYSLLRTIVRDQKIDVVIDTGDLVNFGRDEEARLNNLYSGISSLGVPYVFVRGNHDAVTTDDTALLDQLAETDGVHLVEPSPGQYREITVGGVRIAGFNDPRPFGTAEDLDTERQHGARDRWVEALGERPVPDLTLSHEPVALDDAPGALRVNGHNHVPELEDNRIQVGTLTGVGIFRHFVGTPDTALTSRPSSFDILTFDEDCRAQTLARYQYRSVIEGRPTYDSLSVVNAARVAEDPGEDRSCGGDEVTVRPLR